MRYLVVAVLCMLSTFSGRVLVGVALLLIAALQLKLWYGDGGRQEQRQLKHMTALQQAENEQLAERNRILAAEVSDLKGGTEAVEEHARLDLGLIKPNETFIQLEALPRTVAP